MAQNRLSNIPNLIIEVSEGDQRAFTELFYHYYKSIGKFVYQMTKSAELTEEIVQDAFIKIWLKRQTLKSIDNFDRYLHVVVRNEAINALKKIAADRISSLKIEKFLVEESLTDLSESSAEVYRDLIANAVSKLPEQQRKVYMMSRYDRLKYQEIADQLGLSQTTVKKHIQLAVAFIRAHLADRTELPIVLVLTALIIR